MQTSDIPVQKAKRKQQNPVSFEKKFRAGGYQGLGNVGDLPTFGKYWGKFAGIRCYVCRHAILSLVFLDGFLNLKRCFATLPTANLEPGDISMTPLF